MFDYTRIALKRIIDDFKKLLYIINISMQLLSIAYPLYALISQMGIFVANLILLTLAIGYFIFFLVMETKKGQRKIKKQVKNIYGWCKRLVKLFIIGISVYGLIVAKGNFDPISFLIIILMVFAWILEFLFNRITTFLESETKFLIDGFVTDMENIPVVGGYLLKKITGKDAEEVKPTEKSRKKLDKLVGEARKEKLEKKKQEKLAKKQAKAEKKALKTKNK